VAGVVALALGATLILANALANPGPEVLPRRLLKEQPTDN